MPDLSKYKITDKDDFAYSKIHILESIYKYHKEKGVSVSYCFRSNVLTCIELEKEGLIKYLGDGEWAVNED